MTAQIENLIEELFAPSAAKLDGNIAAAVELMAEIKAMRLKEIHAYISALDAFDWAFEFTDDGTVYESRKKDLDKLLVMQSMFDPEGAIWLAHPGAQQYGAPRPHINTI